MTQAMTPHTVPAWSVGDRIRKARESAGLDQHQLAEITGIARSTISNYERGSTRPSKAYVKSIGLATAVDHVWIWTGSPSGPPGEQANRSTVWYAGDLVAA